ncbi:hypothetical protein HY572_05050 [Candidatus Micrarchaeota archaeon]|nr:hypothetical protein [Candidatus Micrarchaeota archaeon]
MMVLKHAFLALTALALVFALPVGAAPQLPHLFFGNATANGVGIPVGTLVSAMVNAQNAGSVQSEQAGTYGGPSSSQTKLLVQGDELQQGQTVTFFIGRVQASQTASFESSAITQLDLSFAFPAQQNVTVNGSLSDVHLLALPDSPIHVSGTCLDMNINVSTPTAVTINNVTALNSSALPGTVGIGAGNTFLGGYEISVTGAATQVTLCYNDAGIDESAIVPMRFDGTKWVQITPFTLDIANNRVTFTIAAGTPYGVVGSPPAPPGGATPTPSPSASPSPTAPAAGTTTSSGGGTGGLPPSSRSTTATPAPVAPSPTAQATATPAPAQAALPAPTIQATATPAPGGLTGLVTAAFEGSAWIIGLVILLTAGGYALFTRIKKKKPKGL